MHPHYKYSHHQACRNTISHFNIPLAKLKIMEFLLPHCVTLVPTLCIFTLAHTYHICTCVLPLSTCALARIYSPTHTYAHVPIHTPTPPTASDEVMDALPTETRTLATELTNHTALLADLYVLEHYLDKTVLPAVRSMCDAATAMEPELAPWAKDYVEVCDCACFEGLLGGVWLCVFCMY